MLFPYRSFTFVAALLFALLTAPFSHAEIGDTAKDLIDVFGEPQSKDDAARKMVWHRDNGIIYTVEFDENGKSWMEQVEASDKIESSKAVEKLREFVTDEITDMEWEFVDASTSKSFGGRDLKTIHGVIYWRLSKDGKLASAMHVAGKPRIGVLTQAYAKKNPTGPIFAGY